MDRKIKSVHNNPQRSLLCPRCGASEISFDIDGFDCDDLSVAVLLQIRFCWVCGNEWVDWLDYVELKDAGPWISTR